MGQGCCTRGFCRRSTTRSTDQGDHDFFYGIVGPKVLVDGGWIEPSPMALINNESVVVASTDRVLALVFMRSSTLLVDLDIGYVNGKLVLQERKTGSFKRIYDGQQGFVYHVASKGF